MLEAISLLSSDEESDGESFNAHIQTISGTPLKRPFESGSPAPKQEGLNAYRDSINAMAVPGAFPQSEAKRPKTTEEITLSSGSDNDDIVETTPAVVRATPGPTNKKAKLEEQIKEAELKFQQMGLPPRERAIGLKAMEHRQKLLDQLTYSEAQVKVAQERVRAIHRDMSIDPSEKVTRVKSADDNARLLWNQKGQKMDTYRQRVNLMLQFLAEPAKYCNLMAQALQQDDGPTVRQINQNHQQRFQPVPQRYPPNRPMPQFDPGTITDGLELVGFPGRFPNMPQRGGSLFGRAPVDIDSDEEYNAGEGMDEDEAESIRNLLETATAGLGTDVNDSAFDDVENMTPEEMHSKLLPHQSLGVKWMLDAEKVASKRGGLLGDGMGLGKTVQAIALWASKNSEDPAVAQHVPDHAKCTLIIAPVGLLHMWNNEFDLHMKPEHRPRTLLYHGPSTKKQYNTWEKLSENDIILVSFQTLVVEHKKMFFSAGQKVWDKRRGEDGRIRRYQRAMRPEEFKAVNSPFYEGDSYFYRIIIDEAHSIKNRNTASAKACYKLDSVYRWCLTGTPMQNSVEDLQSLVKFLRIKPYEKEKVFNQHIASGIKKAATSGKAVADGSMKRLQSLLALIMLRRGKDSKINGAPILNLPPKNVETDAINFYEDERVFYQDLETGAQRRVSKLIRQGGLGKHYQNVLVLLLRLRQACCHYQLVRAAEANGEEAQELSRDEISYVIEGCQAFSPSTVLRVATLFKQMQDADDLRRQEEASEASEARIKEIKPEGAKKEGAKKEKPVASTSKVDPALEDLGAMFGVAQETQDAKEEEKEMANFIVEDSDLSSLDIIDEPSPDTSAASSINGREVKPEDTTGEASTAATTAPATDAEAVKGEEVDAEVTVDESTPCEAVKGEDEVPSVTDTPEPSIQAPRRHNQVASDDDESPVRPGRSRARLLGAKAEDSEGEGEWLNSDDEATSSDEEDPKGKGKARDERVDRLKRLTEKKIGSPFDKEFDDDTGSEAPGDSYDDAQIHREESRLAEGFECPICTDTVTQAQVRLLSTCGHCICHECSVSYFSSTVTPLCMTCREPISQNSMVPLRVFQKMHLEKKEPREVQKEIQSEQLRQRKHREVEKKKILEEEEDLPPSSKAMRCVELLEQIKEESPGEKTIIFSQFVSFMNLIGNELDKAGFEYLRYEGSMNADDRAQAVTAFRDDPRVSVLLISLKAGNVGLTLTAANHVIIMDPFWNPYVEEQAMDRAHRIGQQREVTVHKIVVAETVEDRILELQKRKREMIESALDPSGQRQMARLSREELLFLFNMRPNPNTIADAAAQAAAA